MYKNPNFELFLTKMSEIENDEINTLISEVSEFYRNINKRFDFCTERYRNAVKSILDTFPLTVIKDVNGNEIIAENINGNIRYRQQNLQIIEIKTIISLLDSYVKKFETVRYLDFLAEANRNVVLVGPNGSGKTTLLRKLKSDTKGASIEYYQADRVFLVSSDFNPQRDHKQFLSGYRRNYEQSTNIEDSGQKYGIVQQFDYTISLLEKERYEEKEKGIADGVTQQIIDEWKNLVKDRELFFEYGLQVRTLDGRNYPLKYLSSGEKSILFFLVEILINEEKDIYFIDEPENNLNPAIVSKLWNFIERQRKNSIFVYLTHDSDFVASRINAKIYWIEKFNGINWEWKQLKENYDLPQELMIQLVGNREPVIFCESNDEYKYDTRIFKIMFPEYKIVSAAGCDKVCSLKKAYEQVGLPQRAYGIIDCDYKNEEYLSQQKDNGVFHLPFFEIENFLFCEKIVKSMIAKYSNSENKEQVFHNLKDRIKEKFVANKDVWITRNTAFYLRNIFNYRGKINSLNSVSDLKKLYATERKTDEEIDNIVSQFEEKFNDIVRKDEYNLYLRYLDNKRILQENSTILEFDTSVDYSSEVLSFLNSEEGEILLSELRSCYFSGL